MSWKWTVLICTLLLLAGAGITVVVFMTEPTATREGATRETAMLVDVTTAQRGTFRPAIVAMGTVQPAREIVLSPRVAGEILSRSDEFTPGGRVDKGELLLTIDPADYENTLRQRKSDLAQAVAALRIEKGRQDVAAQEYRRFRNDLEGANPALVLRKPQLHTIQAQVEAARAAVSQAELELERTTVEAPFDALVLSRAVNVGSQVAAGEALGQLVGLDEYWIVTTVPLSKLRWIDVPEVAEQKGAPVRIRNRAAWPEAAYREGYVSSLIGTLEQQTRLARLLVTVPDPLAIVPSRAGKPALMIGAFVEVRIEAKPLRDVVRLSRDYLRKDDTVWVMEDGRLDIREVDIVLQDADWAYIDRGLTERDEVVTTNLATVTDGARLRLEGDEPADD